MSVNINEVTEKKVKVSKNHMREHDETILRNCDENNHKITDEERLELYEVQRLTLMKLLSEVECKILDIKVDMRRNESK